MFQPDLSFLHKYFMAEKQESLLFIIVGSVAIVLSIIFFFFLKTQPAYFRGAAIPLFVIGVLMGVVGYTVYARTDDQRMDAAYKIGIDTRGFIADEELPRMKKVMTSFMVLRYTELALFLAGLVLCIWTRGQEQNKFWNGMGLTLAIMAFVALGMDYFAEQRGKTYLTKLEQMVKS